MRHRILLPLLLAACGGSPDPAEPVSCLLVQDWGGPEYVSCVAADTGERMFFLWGDLQPVLDAGGHATDEWIAEHRLPDEWFGPDGEPVEGAFE